MTAKEIYRTIKEGPYKDGEALIMQYAKDFCEMFCEWEDVHTGMGPADVGYFKKKIDQFAREVKNEKEAHTRRRSQGRWPSLKGANGSDESARVPGSKSSAIDRQA